MGQAKQRGTYQKRKAEAIERDEKAFNARVSAKIAVDAAKTPEERARERELAQISAGYLGLVGGCIPYYLNRH